MAPPSPWLARLAGGAALVLPLALYLRTAAPTVYGVDSADLTTAAFLLGIAHPPGSPAYLLIAHAFTWLPVGDVGYRVNLLSVVSGALASHFLFRVVRRLSGATSLALLTALCVAASYYVWSACIAAELYAPQACVLAALLALALRWRERQRPALLCAIAALAGIGLGVHLSLVLMLPGLAALVVAPPVQVWRRARVLVAAAASGLLGAGVYLYVPWRARAALPLDPARAYWGVDLTTWSGWWWMVSGAGFHERFFAAAPDAAALATLAYRLWSNFLGLPALLGLAGLFTGLRRDPWVHGALLAMLAGHLAFYLAYGAPDVASMFLPAYVLWGIWLGLGMQALAVRLAPPLGGVDATRLAGAALASLAALLVLVNYRWVDASDDWSARERGAGILAALAPSAVFVGSWSDVRLVEFLQHVEGQRRDVEPVDTFFTGDGIRAERIRAALAAGRPVYVSTCRDLPDPALRCEYDPRCECHRLR